MLVIWQKEKWGYDIINPRVKGMVLCPNDFRAFTSLMETADDGKGDTENVPSGKILQSDQNQAESKSSNPSWKL